MFMEFFQNISYCVHYADSVGAKDILRKMDTSNIIESNWEIINAILNDNICADNNNIEVSFCGSLSVGNNTEMDVDANNTKN